jgi:hypothetical protein
MVVRTSPPYKCYSEITDAYFDSGQLICRELSIVADGLTWC